MIRRETIDEATRHLENLDEHILLLTDGGPENSLKEYLETLGVKVTHQKAMIDVQCSNTLIEAHNKVIKYNYLYRKSINDGFQLIRELDFCCNNFNGRPHISLNGLTPDESYANVKLDDERLRKLKKEAGIKRKQDNLKNRCGVCAT
ncbi:MAG: hypothetical protein JST48_10980 [Bacteroidetes bacterium]|nr:hypothetical protein [Bacteroidota bacterium]